MQLPQVVRELLWKKYLTPLLKRVVQLMMTNKLNLKSPVTGKRKVTKKSNDITAYDPITSSTSTSFPLAQPSEKRGKCKEKKHHLSSDNKESISKKRKSDSECSPRQLHISQIPPEIRGKILSYLPDIHKLRALIALPALFEGAPFSIAEKKGQQLEEPDTLNLTDSELLDVNQQLNSSSLPPQSGIKKIVHKFKDAASAYGNLTPVLRPYHSITFPDAHHTMALHPSEELIAYSYAGPQTHFPFSGTSTPSDTL